MILVIMYDLGMHKCRKGAAFACERADKICDTARNVEADLQNTGIEFTKPPVSTRVARRMFE